MGVPTGATRDRENRSQWMGVCVTGRAASEPRPVHHFRTCVSFRQLLLYTRYAVERVCVCETSGLQYLELVCGVKGEEPLKN